MVRGLYAAYTGMLNEQKRLDVVSNNIANAATVGFKKDGVTNQSFDDVLAVKIKDGSEAYVDRKIGTMNLGVKLGENYTDYTQSSLRETGNTYDMAIEGNGFFKVAVKNSEGKETTKYTRAGNFTMNKDGYIVDSSGNHLLGENGYVQVPTSAASVSIDSEGNVYADGTLTDKIQLADFEDYDYLKKYGDTMYDTLDGATEKDATGSLRQGYTEQSNVQSVNEMVNMIAITRSYEANQKVIQTVDSMLDKTVNSVAKV
ncbi:flagellar basal-body rod protein FlgF [Lachnospiraceae bacterium KM106-2]|nr:flagellar basal-body rod protein FlgF [Lachnospiraceae bacterium KM106-2]